MFHGDIEIHNTSDVNLILKMHRSLGFMLGLFTYQQIKEIGDDYVAFSIRAGQQYQFRADVVQHLKTIYLFVDNLFCGKNQLSENMLSLKDFAYFNERMYSVPTQSTIQMQSKVYKIERERNILFSKVHLEDMFGDKIFFQSVSLTAILQFEI